MFQKSDKIGLIDLPESDYHAHPAISRSGLIELAKSPSHFQTWLKGPKKPTDSMRLGSATHRLILEPQLFESTCVVEPEELVLGIKTKDGKLASSPKSTAEYKEKFAKWSQTVQGKTILDRSEYEQIAGMAASWLKHADYTNVHAGARHEASAFWIDPMTGLQCKARTDIIHRNNMILDLKVTSGLATDFKWEFRKRRYELQVAWYLDGISKATGQKFEQFWFIVIENKPPYGIKKYVCDQSVLLAGREAYRTYLDTYAECLRTNAWPSYPTEVDVIDSTFLRFA